MKNKFLFILLTFMAIPLLYPQDTNSNNELIQGIYALVDTYAQARETKDTIMLESILATDVDQLVSSGKWRKGKKESMKGMLESSANNPGTRTLKIEKIRFLDPGYAIADARYQIQNADGTVKKMWSTFIVVYEQDRWKITAIRNMLPTRP
ncbi:YybH family protein [Maribacter polysaccharolyticus]|uniref:YybH family protein n=1 Tax=Maribacter polysaccharolyticus TaxID=3020831 RepID=UPI00237F26EE|nr:SgcJ/EcaC family oxidoreductase [Maribacter polysaccharolyticus]MDE3743301.1 SgcJ/EcaC family oxidoreductase [Maribacter polysaccharolyticus]